MVNSPIFKGYTGLQETSKSGFLTLGERAVYHYQIAGTYADAWAYAVAHPRWSLWWLTVQSATNLFYVEETKLSRELGGKGVVDIDFVAMYLLPPDEFSLTPFEINPAVERNPYFSALTMDDLTKCRTSFNAATAAGRTSVNAIIGTVTNATLCQNLVNKWLKGEETYYMSGYRFVWSTHTITTPMVYKGGLIQFPFGPFSSAANVTFNWLRQADEAVVAGGIWKLTRTWVGAPGGWWDTDIYPAA